jgi:DNA-binding transcriptional LysR family regulator
VRPRWVELSGRLVDMPASVVSALASGEIDVCLHEHAISDPGVLSESIFKLQKIVACAPTHAAARRRRLRLRDLDAYEFVAPPASRDGIRNDGWPIDVARRVGLTVANMQLGVDAARTGKYLALLPRPIATGSGLVPLAIGGLSIEATSIYASRRRSIATTSDVTDRVVRLLREEIARLDRRS